MEYHVSSGEISTGIILKYDSMYISSGCVASNTTVNSYGSMHISSGGVASNTTVSNGRMFIRDGGVANSTTVDGGYMYVYSESVANSTIINSFGRMTISTGGTASDVHVSSGGVLILKDGAKAGDITVDRAATLYLGDNVTAVGDITVGGVMKSHLMYWYQTLDMAGFTFTFDLRNRYITDGYIVQDISDILNADFAITVSEQQASGTYILASNASDFDSVITINRGTASEEIALGETITIGSTQYSLSYAPQSSTLALTVTTPGGGVIPDRPEYIPGTWSTDWEQALEYAVQTDKLVFCVAGDPSYCSFADYMYKQLLQAEDFINFSKENLILVYNDFPADFTYRGTPTVGIFNADGYELYRKSGFGNGYHDIWMNWLNFVVNPSPGVYTDSGSKLVNRGLSASSVFVVSTCNVIAAELSDSWVSEGTLYVTSGGIVNNIVVKSNGTLNVNDGVANSTTVSNGGMFIRDGGVANSTTVSNGVMYIFEGGVANNTVNYEEMYISSGGVASNTTVSHGFMYISSGGVASDINVNFLGHALFDGGATLRGSNSFGGNVFITNGTVNAAEATLNFAVEQMDPYDVIIYDLSLIIGDPTYTITVSARLEVGTYMLAQGASSFTGTISIGDSTSNYGSLTVNGEDLVYGGKNYSLDQTDGNLTLTIGTYTPSDPDTPDVPDIPDVPAVAEPVTPGASVEFNAESVTVDISVGYKVLNIAALTGKGVNIYAPRVDFGYSVGDAADNADKQTTDADKSVLVKAEKDDMLDLFLANATDVWSSKYVAKHTGTVDKWATGETVELDGKNKIADFFYGSDDDNILYLTDDTNGDGLFVDDIYSAIPGNDLKNTSRIENLKVIYAGSGDDIVDMTSEKMSYTGGGVIVYGGDDDDTIWANNGSNTLYGDAGNDRIVGACGNDLIIGGSGNDSMHGGGGEDTFCFGGEWGNDIVEQLDGGTVTLWFAEGSENNWHVDTFTYCDGENSVKVIGENLTVNFKFGSTDDAPTGAFDGFASEKIFEDKTNGNLA